MQIPKRKELAEMSTQELYVLAGRTIIIDKKVKTELIQRGDY